MLAMSALTLHWQHHWGQSYEQMESAQVLEHRIQESSALLEQHHLKAVRQPGRMVPTNTQKLIYLPTPKASVRSSADALFDGFQIKSIPGGY